MAFSSAMSVGCKCIESEENIIRSLELSYNLGSVLFRKKKFCNKLDLFYMTIYMEGIAPVAYLTFSTFSAFSTFLLTMVLAWLCNGAKTSPNT